MNSALFMLRGVFALGTYIDTVSANLFVMVCGLDWAVGYADLRAGDDFAEWGQSGFVLKHCT